MNISWFIRKKYCQYRSQKLMGKNELLDEYVIAYLDALEFWSNDLDKAANLNFKISDPIIVMEKWLSYKEGEESFKTKHLLYRISTDYSNRIGLKTPSLVVHNFNQISETGACVPLESTSRFSSLVTLPVFQYEYTDWRIPTIVRLAHEIGHAFVFQNWKSPYTYQALGNTVKNIPVHPYAWDLVFDVWVGNWLHELLADLIAALLLGPAGIFWDQKEYITMRRSLNQPIHVGSRTHPPDLLRTYWKVDILNATNTPQSVIDNLKSIVCTPFNRTLLDFDGLGQRYVLSPQVVNHFYSFARDWLRHYGIPFDWNEINSRSTILNQGHLPHDRLGMTVSALLHNAMNTQITDLFDELTRQFGNPL